MWKRVLTANRILLLFTFMCAIFCCVPLSVSALTLNSKDIKSEFGFFITDFFAPEANKLPPWTFNGDNPRVEWAGAPYVNDDVLTRNGIAYVTAAGKRYLKGTQDVPWVIEASGATQEGIERISFEPRADAWGKGNSGCGIPFPDAITVCPAISAEYLCSRVESGSDEQEDFYLARFGDKANVISLAASGKQDARYDTIILHYDMPSLRDRALQKLGGTCNRFIQP